MGLRWVVLNKIAPIKCRLISDFPVDWQFEIVCLHLISPTPKKQQCQGYTVVTERSKVGG